MWNVRFFHKMKPDLTLHYLCLQWCSAGIFKKCTAPLFIYPGTILPLLMHKAYRHTATDSISMHASLLSCQKYPWSSSSFQGYIVVQLHFNFRTQNTNGVGEIRTDISGRPQDRASGTFSLIFKVCTFCSKTKSKKKVILRILELRLFALTLLFVLFFINIYTELNLKCR